MSASLAPPPKIGKRCVYLKTGKIENGENEAETQAYRKGGYVKQRDEEASRLGHTERKEITGVPLGLVQT